MALISDLAESKGRFLVNNILLAWCLVMAQIQFSLIKKIKIGRPEHLLTPSPHSPTSDNISVLPYHPLPPSPHPHQSGRHMCITPHWLFCILVTFLKTVSIVRHYFFEPAFETILWKSWTPFLSAFFCGVSCKILKRMNKIY